MQRIDWIMNPVFGCKNCKICWQIVTIHALKPQKVPPAHGIGLAGLNNKFFRASCKRNPEWEDAYFQLQQWIPIHASNTNTEHHFEEKLLKFSFKQTCSHSIKISHLVRIIHIQILCHPVIIIVDERQRNGIRRAQSSGFLLHLIHQLYKRKEGFFVRIHIIVSHVFNQVWMRVGCSQMLCHQCTRSRKLINSCKQDLLSIR